MPDLLVKSRQARPVLFGLSTKKLFSSNFKYVSPYERVTVHITASTATVRYDIVEQPSSSKYNYLEEVYSIASKCLKF